MYKFIALTILSIVCLTSASYKSEEKHEIELPVHSKHNTEIVPVHTQEETSVTHVEVPGGILPVYITFKTQSSPVHVRQEHRGTKGSFQKSESHDEPHKLTHEVTKPIVQELREVIIPYRKVVQVIEGVKEDVMTKVHKGERHQSGGYGGGQGGGYGKMEEQQMSYGKMSSGGSNGYGQSNEYNKRSGMSNSYGGLSMSSHYGSSGMSSNYGGSGMSSKYGDSDMSSNYGGSSMSSNDKYHPLNLLNYIKSSEYSKRMGMMPTKGVEYEQESRMQMKSNGNSDEVVKVYVRADDHGDNGKSYGSTDESKKMYIISNNKPQTLRKM